MKGLELLPSQILPLPAPEGWDSTWGEGGRQSMPLSRLNLPVFAVSPAVTGSLATGAQKAGDGVLSGLRISRMCGGGQGGRSQGVQVLVRIRPKGLYRVSGRSGPGWPRRREETLRAKRRMDAHRHWGGRTPELKSQSLESNFYLSLNWISDLWACAGVVSFSQGKNLSQVADVKSVRERMWKSLARHLEHGRFLQILQLLVFLLSGIYCSDFCVLYFTLKSSIFALRVTLKEEDIPWDFFL